MKRKDKVSHHCTEWKTVKTGLIHCDFREVIRETGDEVFPSLVYIRVVRDDLSDAKNQKQVVPGSGGVITEDGELLTNHHVIDKATEIRCLLSGGDAYTVKVIGFDEDMDVARK